MLQHDSKEISALRSRLKEQEWFGYGILTVIYQKLFRFKDCKLDIESVPTLAFHLRIEQSKLENLIKIYLELGLLKTDGKTYYSNYVLDEKREQDKQREQHSKAGKKGMESRWKNG